MARRSLGTLVVMGRLPQVGVGKRRLARDVGDLAAWRFYRNTLKALLRRLGRDRRWQVCLAITPDQAVSKVAGVPREVSVVPQGRGDLGQRMGRFLRRLPRGPVVIIGSDIPGIEPRHLTRAFRVLGRKSWVFGPAADGGYWLVGAARRPRLRMPLPFDQVRWSSPQTLSDTLSGLRGASYGLLEQLDDIDSGADLDRYRRAVSR
ncbi:TIGR04282 family arsenosugar biosynthesis glycosyltransferase [Denitrobaculum tricleocarpae]|uniref:Glycosyltransferase n=1 Tax=Denitrobaculum tricleocarpae TaxID=2591009 RepID=A0A545U221_9PROT|nr:TIGR04282 family arsenosugar biosynthesis glycosyltransferase [Denitrobaculum tricleocarpae]TQV83508.1 glycosyltransferase [Denitrobaculum tricleocarpae]